MSRKCIMVLGMHRSGTSAVTGVLQLIGIDLGNDLMPGNDFNPRGFFEHNQVYKINEEILEALGVSWHTITALPEDWQIRLSEYNFVDKIKRLIYEDFEGKICFAFKDPRFCLTFPIWKKALSELDVEVKVLVILRKLDQIVFSLKRREQYSTQKASYVWMNYLLSGEAATRKSDRAFIDIEAFMKDPQPVIEAIASQFGIEGQISYRDRRESIGEFLEPTLMTKPKDATVENRGHRDMRRVEHLLDHLVREGVDFSEVYRELDTIHSAFDAQRRFFFAVHQSRVKNERRRADHFLNEMSSLKKELLQTIEELSISQALSSQRGEEIEDYDRRLGLLQKALADLQNEVASLSTQLESSQKGHSEISRKLANEVKKLVDLVRHRIPEDVEDHKTLGLGNTTLVDMENVIQSCSNMHNALKNIFDRSERDISSLKDEVKSGGRRLHNLQVQLNDIRNSWSFRIGWIATRPIGVIYDFLIERSSVKNTWKVWKGMIDLFIASPGLVFRNLNLTNLRTLLTSIGKEHPNQIITNASRKLHPREELRVESPADSEDLNSREQQLTSIIENRNIPSIPEEKKVSIIVTTRNGLGHLKRLLPALEKNTLYPNRELIIVDNGSTDGSISYIETFTSIKLIRNDRNESFSRANNIGVQEAEGEYLLFLNNDIQPLKGWLVHMLHAFQTRRLEKIGSVGATLIYPKEHPSKPLEIQHRGISFSLSKDFIRPVNTTSNFGDIQEIGCRETVANTAACLLVPTYVYHEVEGFGEAYDYGYEDVDLGLKIIKAGYSNLCSKEALLYHHEFGTQSSVNQAKLRSRRLKNIAELKQNWGPRIRNEYWKALIRSTESIYCQEKLNVALVVTEDVPDSKAGDYYTALELKLSMEKLGWIVTFLSRRKGNWLDVPDGTHVVISLLDAWNPLKLRCANKSLIRVAWCRNWFDRWGNNPGFPSYDLVLTSSRRSVPLLEKAGTAPVHYFPLATNLERFSKGRYKEQLASDYCFTGSYWNAHRDIINYLDPDSLKDYRGAIYGYNWKHFRKFESVYRGPLPYDQLKDVYASTKILIDDANSATREWGSVNSRVFDALGRGTLVVTNGDLGADDLFGGLLPCYSGEASLNETLTRLLSSSDEREGLVQKLQSLVRDRHTYHIRVHEFQDILIDFISRKSLVIKVPAPNWDLVKEWGDYHLALGLQRAFVTEKVRSKIQILPEWNDTTDVDFDSVLVLRGLSKYVPKRHHVNMMWNISHPDKVDHDEYELYDHVFIASESYASKVNGIIDTGVSCLLQCTSTDIFFPSKEPIEHDLLFVGNSRKVFRKIIKDLIPTKYDLAIFGTNWDNLVSEIYVKGTHIENRDLHRYYSGTRVLLNDHWESMRMHGFISNRIFDGLACGALIVSDSVEGLEELFGSQVLIYNTREELQELLDKVFDGRIQYSPEGVIDEIHEKHTFCQRVKTILEVWKVLPEGRNRSVLAKPVTFAN